MQRLGSFTQKAEQDEDEEEKHFLCWIVSKQSQKLLQLGRISLTWFLSGTHESYELAERYEYLWPN